MAKNPRSLREIERDELALAAPRMTVLSDRPLLADEAHLDSLNLPVKLGPVFDILRHPQTRTPLSIAIYGHWGTGKTSAMKWLEGMLRVWNDRGDHGQGVVVRPVWFYPWKYHSKDDVWRGLISEVILASLSAREITVGRLRKVVKQFGIFLGRSFLHVVSNLRVASQISPAVVEDIYEEYRKLAHPEAGYLNQFEATLTKWIHDTISVQNERMVVFIDDLDRCMPDVALQVLEALKLYLNIEDLIFVVGVDRVVIDQLIRQLYGNWGLDQEKSKHYLAKMFQVEVTMAPTEHQAEGFLDEQLGAIAARTSEYWHTELDDEQRQLFRGAVLRLAERNPREVKRLLNSGLIHGAGAKHAKSGTEHAAFSFAQGVQVFLVRKILEERYTMGLTVDTRAGLEFFQSWSERVRAGAPPTVDNPEERAKLLTGKGQHVVETSGFLDEEFIAIRPAPGSAPATAATPYDDLLTSRAFAHLRKLLADPDLGALMRIPYPADTSQLAAASMRELPSGLIREAIARQRGKPPPALTAADFLAVTHLRLTGPELVDVAPLQALTRLESLDLTNTAVSDLAPLQSLAQLQSLYLASTRISDVSPLAALTQLRGVSLMDTDVADVSALAGLTELLALNLSNTRVADLSPLRGLVKLRSLYLVGTPVVDLTPLSGMVELQVLDLSESGVTREAVDELRRALPELEVRGL